ncbi:alpha/beta fold hydrolase [Ramlibacter sp. MAHUQ-53]|uniref:alpha/beta fold hydrolase n=1 Tax=unclassified Ramlibacter TaxID=2617605 RepID=UPI0036351A69
MYQPRRESHSEFVPIRNLTYHVRTWGTPSPAQPSLVLVHGWMDVSASWQFVVDAMARDRHVIAPDWRGFGLTEVPGADSFWFPDYLADLDALLDHYLPDTPVDLVGHSMGGIASMQYAGVRPDRIRRLVNLEGFGMPPTRPAQAPGRYARWLDEVRALHRGEGGLRPYPSAEAVAHRLMKNNRRLPEDKAQWLARHWARERDGAWHILGQPAHKIVSAHLFRADEVMEVYRQITAPVLWVQASGDEGDAGSRWWKAPAVQAEVELRLNAVPNLRRRRVEDAGHMLHHDQPAAVAHAIETFFSETR